MSVEENKVDDINNEDMRYYGEDDELQRTSRKKYVIGVELLRTRM